MSIKYHEWSEEELTYPEFYKTGDQVWLGRQLGRLTFELRKQICEEYREHYLKHGRNSANKMLLDFCNENGRQHAKQDKHEINATNPLQDRVNKLRSATPKRKSILDMADGK